MPLVWHFRFHHESNFATDVLVRTTFLTSRSLALRVPATAENLTYGTLSLTICAAVMAVVLRRALAAGMRTLLTLVHIGQPPA
jgi:hypothetical protein